MLYVLADTDVWLDLAKDVKGQKVIAAIRELHHETRLTLLVSQLLLDEFERNRSRVEADLTRSMSETVRLVRKEIVQHGQDDREAALAELDNLTQGIPLLKQSAARNFDEVHEMLVNGRWLTPTPEHLETAANWGLEKRAPFHQNRNSVADALHLLVYASAIDDPPGGPDDRFCFVTKNVKDFSTVNEDQRLPHPDIADLFSGPLSDYYIDLGVALAGHFPSEYDDLLQELDFHEEPRSYKEIRAAEEEFFDRVWYQRSINREHRDGADPEEARRIAEPGRTEVEARYGAKHLGPYTDFEWGMINGKLSTLRWVTGSEWDFLDT
jgi:hypothetical protein